MARPTNDQSGWMSGGNWPANPWFDQAMRFTEMWTDLASKMATAATSLEPETSPPDAARQMRSIMFKTMSQFTEQFMRWPHYLTAMRQSMDTVTTMQKQMNDFLTAARHNTQGVARADVDSLLQSMEHLETRVLDRLEELAEQVDELSRKLAAAENNGQAHVGEEEEEAAPERSERTGGSRRHSRRTRDEISRS